MTFIIMKNGAVQYNLLAKGKRVFVNKIVLCFQRIREMRLCFRSLSESKMSVIKFVKLRLQEIRCLHVCVFT